MFVRPAVCLSEREYRAVNQAVAVIVALAGDRLENPDDVVSDVVRVLGGLSGRWVLGGVSCDA